jgi:hypothetical protein
MPLRNRPVEISLATVVPTGADLGQVERTSPENTEQESSTDRQYAKYKSIGFDACLCTVLLAIVSWKMCNCLALVHVLHCDGMHSSQLALPLPLSY